MMTTPIPTNQCAFTLAEIVDAVGDRHHSSTLANADGIRGVSIDTRSLAPGDLFVALRGATSDGHDYLAQASRVGAGVCRDSSNTAKTTIPR